MLGKVLLVVSSFTILCGCWLAVMELVLRHPGYMTRCGIAFGIVVVSFATIAAGARHFPGIQALGAAILFFTGVQAFIHNQRSAHFEGFVLVISLSIVMQGLLILMSMRRTATPLPPS